MDTNNATSLVFDERSEPIKLDDFRNLLIRQEETIIFALIERAQFPHNPQVYDDTSSNIILSNHNNNTSFLDFLFKETEKLHALVRRYTSPDEHSFYLNDNDKNTNNNEIVPILPLLSYSNSVIKPNNININPSIKASYLSQILPTICKNGSSDSNTYGSSVTCDIAVLQALSKRIHFGKFIAEAKFQSNVERYTSLIKSNDAIGLMKELTNATVEKKVLDRVSLKASNYGQHQPQSEVSEFSRVISNLYRDVVMPLTKEVQVSYLLQRLECHQYIASTSSDHDNDYIIKCNNSKSVIEAVLSNKAAYGLLNFEKESSIDSDIISLLVSYPSIKVCEKKDDDNHSMVYVGKSIKTATGNDRTLLYVSVNPSVVGSLMTVLSEFKNNGVNMGRLESLETTTVKKFKEFYIEVIGHVTSANVNQALFNLNQDTSEDIKVLFLGCYSVSH